MKATEIVEIVKATIEAMDVKGDDRGFHDSMRRFRLGPEKLELWINAYEAGGISGIRALTETFSLKKELLDETYQQIRRFFQVAWPGLEYKIMRRHNRFTILVKETDGLYIDLCQLRYTPFDQRWYLFWKRNNGKWWPYVSDYDNTDGLLWKTLYAVKLDYYGLFTR